jgi:hypothetical protein
MSGRECARLWQVDAYRAGLLGEKDAQSFERHARTCATCRTQVDDDERLRQLACALPYPEPAPLVLRRLRARLLRGAALAAAPERRTVGWRLGVALALVVTVAVAVGLPFARRAAAPSPGAASGAPAPVAVVDDAFAGSIAAAPEARWSQARRAGVETVALTDGSLHVKVRPQSVGERFLVALPDGEIEVRGTEFDVSVEGGTTRSVRVAEGVVELRIHGQDVLRLGATESWPPPPRAVVQDVPEARLRPQRSSARPPLSDDPSEEGSAIAYAAAVRMLREGSYDEAAARFHALALSRSTPAQAEDASFLEAVALARAGRTDAAALAAEHHLAAFPRSFHAREAAILVARAAGLRGDCGKARSVLAPWTNASAGPDVRTALGPCALAADASRP